MIELRDQDNTLLLSVPDNPQAAECCTELGQDEPEFYGREYWKKEAVNLIIFAVALVALMGTLAVFFAG